MHRRKFVYDLIRATLRFTDYLWFHHWRYVLLGMAGVAGVVWWRAVSVL